MNGVYFENTPDLFVEFVSENVANMMEAYPSVQNKEILKEKADFDKLEWFSIGHPTLQRFASNKCTTALSRSAFKASRKGFSMLIDILTENQKMLFQDKIKQKYFTNVKNFQISRLLPSSIECAITLNCEEDTFVVKGSTSNLRESPLRVDFSAPFRTRERKCFEMHLIENEEIEVNCEIAEHSNRSERLVTKPFTLTTADLLKYNLINKLFEKHDDSIYITQDQLKQWILEIYKLFHVSDKFNITHDEFYSTFTLDMPVQYIYQVPFEDGLALLSRYGIPDFDIEHIKSEFQSIFQNTSNENDASSTQQHDNVPPALFSTGFKLLGGLKSWDYLKENRRFFSLPVIRPLMVKLLNLNTQDHIEWALEGLAFAPKSLYLRKLKRSDFEKDLEFKSIKVSISVNDDFFKRDFMLRVQGMKRFDIFHSHYLYYFYLFVTLKMINLSV